MKDGLIGLYFSLRDDEKADLEIVAQAAIHWVAAVRAAANAIEPNVQIRIELVNADESSLRLNTILEWAEAHLAHLDRGSSQYPRLRSVAVALAMFIAGAAVDPVLDIFRDPPIVSLSDEDWSQLKELLDRVRSEPTVQSESRKFFRTLDRDKSISGVGVSEGRTDPPVILVPRDQFPERSGLWITEDAEQERTLTLVLDVTLISPVLLPRPRSWRFRPEGMPEFNAIMSDKKFLEALEESHVRETLRTGIPMTIRLEVKEQKIDGEWIAKRKGRSVVEVISPVVMSFPSDPE